MSKYIFYKSVDRNVSKEEVLKAVLENGLNLSLYRNYNNDYDVVMTAINNNPLALNFVGEDMLKNYEVVLNAVSRNGVLLRLATFYKNDLDIVRSAVLNDPKALEFAGGIAQNDYDIVLSAVSRNGMMLEYASLNLRGDYFIVHTALKQNYEAFRFANLSLDKLNYSKDVLSDIADFFGYEFVSEESLIVSRIKSLEDKRRKIDKEIWDLKCELKDCELGSSKVLSK